MPLLPNVAGLVDNFNVGPLTVHRPGLPTETEFGDFLPAVDATVQLNPVAVHTLSGRDLEQLPEADRNTETIQLYTRVRLFVADGGAIADVVEYQGRSFRVTQVQDNDPQGGVYIALAQLVEAVTPEGGS